MPAVSKAQQKFFGMVDAAQKGELEHPSASVKKAASSMSHSDVNDFASTKHDGLPNHVDETENVLESIARYNEYGKALRRDTTLQEIGMQLARIAELAEQAVVNEADDWFDAHTLKRNMKEIKSYANDFVKLAKESDMINQRMTALYDDMGRILERYFEIPDTDVEKAAASDDTVAMNAPSRKTAPMKDMPVQEDALIPANPTEPAIAVGMEIEVPDKHDELTIRA